MAAAALAAAAWIALRNQPAASDVDKLASLRVERLTYDAGLTTMPAISSDGRLIAYASDRAGRGDLDIWVQLADGSPLRLTTDPADEVTPRFSPDGNQIVFRSERAGGGVYVMSTLGGEPRLIAQRGRDRRFSPDGSRVAYWFGGFRGGSTCSLRDLVVPLSGGEQVRLLAEFETARDPIWAPDGGSLLVAAVGRRTAGPNEVDWWWTPLDGERPSRTGASQFAPVKAALAATERAEWTSEGVVFTDGRDLWRLAISSAGVTGQVQRLTVGAQNYCSRPRAATDESCSRRQSRTVSSAGPRCLPPAIRHQSCASTRTREKAPAARARRRTGRGSCSSAGSRMAVKSG